MKRLKKQNHFNNIATVEKPLSSSWHYADLVENIDMGIIVLDLLKERVVAMNKTAESYFKNNVKPKDFRSLYNLFFQADDKNQMNINWYVPREQVLEYGSHTYGYTIHPMQGGYMGLFVQDITQKLRQREKVDSLEFVDNLNTIFAGIHQEFSKPVGKIKQMLQMLRKAFNKTPLKNVRRSIDLALGQLNKLEYLLKLLKDFNTYNAVNLQPIRLSSFMSRFISLANQFLQRKDIKLETIFPQEEIFCDGDPELLKKALFNIITNAVDALSDILYPKIIVTFYQNIDRIHITIEDNGHGVPTFLQDKIFYPFYTSKIGAGGLGLTITKKILIQMNGSIRINSLRGIGTVVEITLPTSQIRE